MAGVKDCTPGFARDAFGLLYLRANNLGAKMKFTHTNKKIRPIILSGISSVI